MDFTPKHSATPTLADGVGEETPYEHLAIRSVEEVQEYVDARLSLSSRPTPRELEDAFPQSIIHHTPHEERHEVVLRTQESGDTLNEKRAPLKGEDAKQSTVSIDPTDAGKKDEILYVDWEENDPRNPANFPHWRKWLITVMACCITGQTAFISSTFAMGFTSMERDLNCSHFEATLALSIYLLGFALFPLFLAPLSEEFGRQNMYIVSIFTLLLMLVGTALSQNIQSVIVLRFIGGAAGSTGATLVGGTIADIWAPHERGVPMGFFSTSAMASTGLGPVVAGWIAFNRHLEWRWIQWVNIIITGAVLLGIIFGMKETRSSVILTRLAKKLRKKTKDNRYRARIEDERTSLKTLIFISCTRPIYLLFTEPVVASFSIWVGFAWGILYVLVESITPAFQQLHGFNIGLVGTVYITLAIGSVLGYITNVYVQERIYTKKFPTVSHEARLYTTCVAAITFPVAMFIYAGTSQAQVHWIGMCIAIVLFMWSLYMIYLAVFTYLADCYGPFASSAMAGQSLSRNMLAFIFPLFTTQMYDALTFKWANVIFGFIALIMAPIPFVLFRWGPQIRARSKFASQVSSFSS